MMSEKLDSFLHHCAKTKSFRCGLSLHAAAIKRGMQDEVVIANHIINFYGKCDRIDLAHQLFVEMPDHNLVTWSAMISGYNQSNKPLLGLQHFCQMQTYFKPNEFAFASALSSCSRLMDLDLGKQIHAQALKQKHDSVSFVLNSLILMYMKCGMCSDAMQIITGSKPDFVTSVSYNIAITGLVENKQQEKGIEMFKIMCRQGLLPDCFTFAGLLGPGEPIYHLSVVVQLHCQMVKFGLNYTAFFANILITLYSKFCLLEESEKVFRSIEEKDAISWNAAIIACCHCEDNLKGLSIFREMVMEHNLPDDFMYASVLAAAAGLASMKHGKEIHGQLIRTRADWDVGVKNALINMYSKSGSISSGYTIFKQMESHNLVSWNSIMAAFANHGLAEKAIALFEEMTRTRLEPDTVTFLELLTACNHSGLANKGQDIFNSMSKVYGVTPSVEHLCCLVDLLGRAGRMKEAEEYIHIYSVGDDPIVLGALLSACRLHGEMVVGKRIAKRLIELHPVTASPYVLLSNLYASDLKWESVVGARKMLQISGLKKEAAHSVI